MTNKHSIGTMYNYYKHYLHEKENRLNQIQQILNQGQSINNNICKLDSQIETALQKLQTIKFDQNEWDDKKQLVDRISRQKESQRRRYKQWGHENNKICLRKELVTTKNIYQRLIKEIKHRSTTIIDEAWKEQQQWVNGKMIRSTRIELSGHEHKFFDEDSMSSRKRRVSVIKDGVSMTKDRKSSGFINHILKS